MSFGISNPNAELLSRSIFERATCRICRFLRVPDRDVAVGRSRRWPQKTGRFPIGARVARGETCAEFFSLPHFSTSRSSRAAAARRAPPLMTAITVSPRSVTPVRLKDKFARKRERPVRAKDLEPAARTDLSSISAKEAGSCSTARHHVRIAATQARIRTQAPTPARPRMPTHRPTKKTRAPMAAPTIDAISAYVSGGDVAETWPARFLRRTIAS